MLDESNSDLHRTTLQKLEEKSENRGIPPCKPGQEQQLILWRLLFKGFVVTPRHIALAACLSCRTIHALIRCNKTRRTPCRGAWRIRILWTAGTDVQLRLRICRRASIQARLCARHAARGQMCQPTLYSLILRNPESALPAPRINLLEYLLRDACFLILLPLPPQSQRHARILDTVVHTRLHALAQEEPAEEPQAQLPAAALQVEEVDRVNHLSAWDVDVDGAEVFRQPVPDKDAAEVEEQPDLLVGRLETNESASGGVRRSVWREVAGGDARIGGQVVYHGIGDVDVVVNEWSAIIARLLRGTVAVRRMASRVG